MRKKYALMLFSLFALALPLSACDVEGDGPGNGGDDGGTSSGTSGGGSSGGSNGGGSNGGGSNGGGSNGGGSGNNGSVSVSLTANPQSGSVPFEVTLRADASSSNGGNIAYRWTVPRGNVRAGSSYKVLVTEAGAQTFSVTASNGGDRATADVTVQASEPTLEPGNDRPVLDNDVQTNPSEGTSPLTVTFTARASDPNGDTLDYIWDFGDGGEPVGGGATLTHVYEEPSYYPVQVFVSDGRGGVDVAYTGVDVNPPPATINLDVTPDGATWEVYNDYYYDDDYGFSESGTGDATITVPSEDYYYVDVSAEGYESGYDSTDYLEPGNTANLSVALELIDGGTTTDGTTTDGTTTDGGTTNGGGTTTGTTDGGTTGTTSDGSTTGTTSDGTTTDGTTTDGGTTDGGTTGTTSDGSTTGDTSDGGTTGTTSDGGTTGTTTGDTTDGGTTGTTGDGTTTGDTTSGTTTGGTTTGGDTTGGTTTE